MMPSADGPGLGDNRAGARELAEVLQASGFGASDGAALDLVAFAEKLLAHAERFERWEADVLVGLVALYANDPSGTAFITAVATRPQHRRRGIAADLLSVAIGRLERAGRRRVELEVAVENPAALLYRGLGFEPLGPAAAGSLRMARALGAGAQAPTPTG